MNIDAKNRNVLRSDFGSYHFVWSLVKSIKSQYKHEPRKPGTAKQCHASCAACSIEFCEGYPDGRRDQRWAGRGRVYERVGWVHIPLHVEIYVFSVGPPWIWWRVQMSKYQNIFKLSTSAWDAHSIKISVVSTPIVAIDAQMFSVDFLSSSDKQQITLFVFVIKWSKRCDAMRRDAAGGAIQFCDFLVSCDRILCLVQPRHASHRFWERSHSFSLLL